MTEPFIGEIKMVGFNFAPVGYLLCNGQIMSIAQNTALFSLLGTTFGGNGQTTFALPDLRGRAPLHWGQGPGLSNYNLGQLSGTETNTLITTNLPAHAHTFAPPAVGDTANSTGPSPSSSLAIAANGEQIYSTSNPNTTLKAGNTGIVGNNQPVNNMQPYLVVTFIIATQGIYPSRP